MGMTHDLWPVARLAAVSADTFWTIVVVLVIGGIGVIPAFIGYYWFVVIPQRELHRQSAGGGGSAPRSGATPTSPSPSYGRR
jgi:hypothetical protein